VTQVSTSFSDLPLFEYTALTATQTPYSYISQVKPRCRPYLGPYLAPYLGHPPKVIASPLVALPGRCRPCCSAASAPPFDTRGPPLSCST